jgi:hypothetical protein
MWGELGLIMGSSFCDSRNGEAWQYMGTHAGFHEFRHRDLEDDALRHFERQGWEIAAEELKTTIGGSLSWGDYTVYQAAGGSTLAYQIRDAQGVPVPPWRRAYLRLIDRRDRSERNTA